MPRRQKLIDPTWVGAIGQWVGALATLSAVIVALWQVRKGFMLTMEAKYDAARPVLVICDPLPDDAPPEMHFPYGQKDHPAWLDWERPEYFTRIENIGSGAA